MSRIHLFEFEDQKWFPTFLRNYLTDFLQFGSNKFNMYSGIVPILKKGLEKSTSNQIIDLASGGGGGLISLSKELLQQNPNLKILLTDFYPNKTAFDLQEVSRRFLNLFQIPLMQEKFLSNLKVCEHSFYRFIILNLTMHVQFCKMQ